jgi:hypothetical protein
MVQPWIEAGYEAITVDLQESPTANPARHHFVADVTKWRYPLRFGRPAIVFAFPPCTHLAVSGARWFAGKGMGALIEGLSIVDACRDICESCGAPPSDERADFRSATPMGFARAVFLANSEQIQRSAA